ncbi:MAG TPA: preprotein translocase subunit YajC [Bacillota bacterium]
MDWLILAATQPAAAAANGATGAASIWGGLLPMILILVFFWIIIIMPQRKQQKQRDAMLKNLKKGDKVITAGGLHGEIVEIDEEDVRLRVADKVELKFTRGSISRVKS